MLLAHLGSEGLWGGGFNGQILQATTYTSNGIELATADGHVYSRVN
jgi:hypothetical protein